MNVQERDKCDNTRRRALGNFSDSRGVWGREGLQRERKGCVLGDTQEFGVDGGAAQQWDPARGRPGNCTAQWRSS